MTTTPNEFLQFAKEMGLGQIKSTPLPNNNNNGYTLTGLSVLNNLCHLIEHIHTLKAENDHLRAHLELVNHVEKFLLKTEENKKLINEKEIKILHDNEHYRYDEEKSSTLSPSNSLKTNKQRSPTLSISSRERQGVDLINNHDDSLSMLHIDHDPSEIMESNLGLSGLPSWNNWSKVRHALKFSLRRKQISSTSPILNHTERIIPAISISVESDDDHLSDNKYEKKKKKILTINDNRRGLTGDDTDQDDESIEFNRVYHKRKLYRNDRTHSSSYERQETSTSNLLVTSAIVDDENLLTHKQSKIAHYRRKLRSKLNTVKKQFSDQHSSSSLRILTSTHGSTIDDFGSGLNQALLTAKLAPAMTKSYQQKMREWQTMQKSNFLVDYRRQSVTNKIELNNDSRKTSVITTINETSIKPITSSIDISNSENETNILTLSPTLSPNQRSLIAHQWREIMSEEICLRHYNEYLQRKMQQLKQLETDLKSLKTNIFCTNNQEYFLKHRSMTSIDQFDQYLLNQHSQTSLPQRCRSFQSLISMPASWILAVQSAAYSDILDGTSKKTTEQAIIFNKNFFNQLKHFKDDRQHFEQEIIKELPKLRNSKTNILYEENLNEKRSNRPRTRFILTRACLRRLSLISPTEIPQSSITHPLIPLQIIITKSKRPSRIDVLPSPTTSEAETNFSSPSSTILNKRSKRSRFDFKKTLQRSKTMCMTQFNSWLQRRRQHQQQHPFIPRRKSAIDSKTNKEIKSSPCSTPKLLGSPRLARLHQRIIKKHPTSPSSPHLPPTLITEFPLISSSIPLDDSDQQFEKPEPPVRIYLPARTSPITTRHVRITDIDIINDNNNIKTPPMSKITSPIINRRNLPSAMKVTTARERRESYAALSNILNNQ